MEMHIVVIVSIEPELKIKENNNPGQHKKGKYNSHM